MTRNDKCPHCGKKLKAHGNHDKTFDDLDVVQQSKSIRLAALNLQRAIKVWALEDPTERACKTIEVVRLLLKGGA